MDTSILEDKEILNEIKGIVEWFSKKSCYDGYLIHLVDLIGATIVGVKPAELINISVNQGGIKYSDWEEFKACLFQNTNIKLREVKKHNGKVQILFYHSTSLDKALCNKAKLRFLCGLGYPEQYSLESYVDFLVYRLNRKDFPHEIGIFLGYPFKDVLGYIGHSSLKLARTNGWKIYGNDKLSTERYHSFLHARIKVRELMSLIFSA